MGGISPAVLVIIGLTALISYYGFQNRAFFEAYKFQVRAILEQKQWIRIISSGFLHADLTHLFFNMFTLFFFAPVVEERFGTVLFVAIYILSILVGNLYTLFIHKNQPYYSAIGASGGVTGILFASIAVYPEMGIYIFLIPIAIPAWIYAIAYLGYSIYGMKKQVGNIGHSAHLGGAVAGFAVALGLAPELISQNGLYIGIMCIPIAFLLFQTLQRK